MKTSKPRVQQRHENLNTVTVMRYADASEKYYNPLVIGYYHEQAILEGPEPSNSRGRQCLVCGLRTQSRECDWCGEETEFLR